MQQYPRRRMLFVGIFLIGLCAAAPWAFGHLCNNIYRTPDRVIVKPEKPVATVVGNEQFRVFVQNNYPTFLDNLRLAGRVDANGMSVTVTPEVVKRLKPGERTAFTVKLAAAAGTKGKHTLAFSISADNLGWKPVAETKPADFKYVLAHEDNLSATVQAAESLVIRRDPEGSKYLTELARNKGAGRDYQARAIRAIGKGGEKKNIAFLQTFLTDQDGFLRGNALLALGALGDKAVTFSPYYTDRDEFVRCSAMAGRILAGGKEKNLLSSLTQGLRSPNVYVRIACAWGLASRRDKNAIAVLDQALQTDDGSQRTTAGDALVYLANKR